jgi:hypothetical protein
VQDAEKTEFRRGRGRQGFGARTITGYLLVRCLDRPSVRRRRLVRLSGLVGCDCGWRGLSWLGWSGYVLFWPVDTTDRYGRDLVTRNARRAPHVRLAGFADLTSGHQKGRRYVIA